MPLISKSSLDLFAYFLSHYRWQSITVVLCLLLGGVAETLGIGALLPLISLVIDGENAASDSALQVVVSRFLSALGLQANLETLLAIIVGMIVTKSVIVFFTLRYAGFVAADIAKDFQLRLIRALMSAQWQYFSDLPLGVVSNSIAAESQRAGHSYMLAGRAFAAATQTLIYLGIAFLVLWKLSVLAIVLGVVLGFAVKKVMQMSRNAGTNLSQTMDTLLARLNDSLSGAKPLKAMRQEDRFCDQLEKEAGQVVKARKKQYESGLLLQIIYEPSLIICVAIALYYVLTFTTTPISEVLLLAFLFQRLMGYVNTTQAHFQNMVQNENAVWSLLRQIDEAEQNSETLQSGEKPVFKDRIEIQNINLAYKKGQSVFDNFSANIPARQVSVIFGPSGIGKTTLTDAILGLLEPQSGHIKVDGTPLKELDLAQWRSLVGYVPQDTFLFHDSIYQNVTLGDASYSEGDVISALQKSAAYEFVEKLDEGVHSIVGERGSKLSGGQRQRIALARALIRQPALLILDEPTSALDSGSEKDVLNTLKALSSDVAVVIVSHNESVLKIADNKIDLGKKYEQAAE